jgi:hypothetical protein
MDKNNVKYLVVLGYTIYIFDNFEDAEEFFNNEPDAVELVGVRLDDEEPKVEWDYGSLGTFY